MNNTELAKSIKDKALKIKNEDISKALGKLPTQRVNCSVLAKTVLRDAIFRYTGNREKKL